MFSDLLDATKVKASILFWNENGRLLNYKATLKNMTSEKFIEAFGEDALHCKVEAVSVCASPFFDKKTQPAKTVAQMLVEIHNVEKDLDFFEDNLFVIGGWYGVDQHWGMKTPSKSGLPYVFVGKPWAPNDTVYKIGKNGCLEMTEYANFGDGAGPQIHRLTDTEIHDIETVLRGEAGCIIYS